MLNKVQLHGRLGANPEIKNLPDGRAYCQISLANKQYRKDKHTNEKTKITLWHKITLFNKNAENICKLCNQGDLIYIEGEIIPKTIKDSENKNKYVIDIIATSFEVLHYKSSNSEKQKLEDENIFN